jgi:hypothetical protein
MKLDVRRVVCVATLVLASTGVGTVAQAATLPDTTIPTMPPQQQVDANQNSAGQNSAAQNTGDQDSHSNNGLWGLVGLVGLLGLAGLMRRGPKPGAMDGYPVAGSGEPPMNAYPPAPPTRVPPGA